MGGGGWSVRVRLFDSNNFLKLMKKKFFGIHFIIDVVQVKFEFQVDY